MDWIIWVIAGIIILGILIGIYRGALRIIVSLVTAVLTIYVTVYATPYVSQMVIDKTPLDESIKNYVVSTVDDMIKNMMGLEEEETEEETETAEEIEIPRDIQIQAIESTELPTVFQELLLENNNEEIYRELGVDSFAQYVGTYLARTMIRIGVFLVLLLLVTIGLRAVVFALNVVNEIPVFGFMNRFLGALLSGGFSFLVIWFLFMIITLMYTSDVGREMYEVIQENDYTRILYENNPLLDIFIKKLK